MEFELWHLFAEIGSFIFVISIIASALVVLAPDKIFGVNDENK